MSIITTDEFEMRLSKIVSFIAIHSVDSARKFYKELYAKIAKILQMPYSYRKNELMGDENIRDMIYKGYVVVFKITAESIIILSIYKWNLWNPSYSQ